MLADSARVSRLSRTGCSVGFLCVPSRLPMILLAERVAAAGCPGAILWASRLDLVDVLGVDGRHGDVAAVDEMERVPTEGHIVRVTVEVPDLLKPADRRASAAVRQPA